MKGFCFGYFSTIELLTILKRTHLFLDLSKIPTFVNLDEEDERKNDPVECIDLTGDSSSEEEKKIDEFSDETPMFIGTPPHE